MELNNDGLKIALVGALALGLLWVLSKSDAPAAPRRSKAAPIIDHEPVEEPPTDPPAKEPAPAAT